MKRVMCVWLPALAIDLVRRSDQKNNAPKGGRRDRRPILLVATARQRRVVVACCERAGAAGVVPGMPLSDAGALLPRGNARVMDHAPRRDRAALRRLAERLQRFSPITAVDELDGLLLDIAGCAHLFGGEGGLRRRVIAALRGIGIAARAAIASTVGCAWAVSRFGDMSTAIVPEGGERRAMEPLPIEALRLTEESRLGLAELSVERVGQLLDLPRSSLPARFGADVLSRLDEALGGAVEFIEPVAIDEPIRGECVFEGPTTRVEVVELATQRVIGQLVPALLARECGVTRLELVYARSDLAPESILIPLTRPSRDAKHLWSLVRPRLERLNMGFGICGVSACAARLGRLRHEQASMPEVSAGDVANNAHDEAVFAEMLDALVNRCGPERVRRVEPFDSHVPERAFRSRSVLDPSATKAAQASPGSIVLPESRGDRPTLLLDRPEPVRVIALTPDGPVSRLAWNGADRAITRCVGPERVEPEWWRGPSSPGLPVLASAVAPRDYFKVQDERGRWLWLYRQQGADAVRWFVHGVWA